VVDCESALLTTRSLSAAAERSDTLENRSLQHSKKCCSRQKRGADWSIRKSQQSTRATYAGVRVMADSFLSATAVKQPAWRFIGHLVTPARRTDIRPISTPANQRIPQTTLTEPVLSDYRRLNGHYKRCETRAALTKHGRHAKSVCP